MKLRDFEKELKKCGCDIQPTKKNRIRIFFDRIPIGNIPNFLEIAGFIVKDIRREKTEVKERRNM